MTKPSFSILRVVAFAALLALLAGASMQTAQAQILTIEDTSNNLGTVNITTGAVTVIGNLGGTYQSDIAYSPAGVLYGISYYGLYRINTVTATVTYIGALGISGANALVFNEDGTLYMASYESSDLFTVNTATGAATDLGYIGFGSAGDLAFNDGELYLSSSSNQLVRIDLSGKVSGTAVGPFGLSNVYGLASINGTLYGISGTRVYSIDTNTGQCTFVLDYGGHGLGYAGGAAAPIGYVPILGALSPPSTDAGGHRSVLNVKGSNFTNASIVNWNGSPLTTTYVSGDLLKAEVPASLIATPGKAEMSVTTPDVGTSRSEPFTILQTTLKLTGIQMSMDGNGNYVASVSLKNAGYLTAPSVTITKSTLNGASALNLPVTVGNLASGATNTTNLTFPAGAGTSGQTVVLKIASAFTGGKFSGSAKVILP